MSLHTKHKIIILNRWDDEFADYTHFIDHSTYEIRYITNKNGSIIKRVPDRDIIVVDDLLNQEQVLAAAHTWVTHLQGVTRIIALSEYDLEMAAYLRTYFSVMGIQEDQVFFYRDKIVMKNKITASGLKAPMYASIQNVFDVLQASKEFKFPLILKPCRGAASQGIYRINSAEDLNSLQFLDLKGYECEQFITGNIYHIDGAVKNTQILFSVPSQYINTCLEFANGSPLGGVNVQDHNLKKKIQDFTEKVIQALELNNSLFHLEVIISDKDQEIYFLEIGARCAGTEIPFIFLNIHGLNLAEIACRIEIEEDFNFTPPLSFEEKIGGYLAIPAPRTTPCVVTKVTSLKADIKSMYCEIIPPVGYAFTDEIFSYYNISGRFRYVGSDFEEIKAAIEQSIQLFCIETKPLISVQGK